MTSYPQSDDSIDLSGRLLGDYQVIRWLGRGGMAEVYLTQQQSLQRHVALKVLKPELAEDAQYVRRFQNEAQAAAALVHANIVQIHEVGCIDGLQFIAQEYVRGQNLKEMLTRVGSMNAQQTVSILRQVAAALCKAAEHGIVHRDIKPENILISTDGTVKVADFGLARKNENKDGTQLTQIGVTMGTPLYMSPEQVEGRPLDGRTDIYSLGVTAYQMLAGRPPFDGDTPLSIALQHVKEEPAPLADARGDVPKELLTLIHRLLSKKPDERCCDASEVLDELDKLPIAGGRSRVDTQSLAGSVKVGGERLESTFDVTQTLAMALNKRPSLGGRVLGWMPVVLAGIVGAALALPLRSGSGDPLEGAQPSSATKIAMIPQEDTVEAQFYRATMAKSDFESAWKSVIEYPDVDPFSETQQLTVNRAKQQLSRWYIKNKQPADAIPYLKELAELDDTQNELRAIGLAWQAIAYRNLEQYDDMSYVLAEVFLLGDFLDPRMYDQLEEMEEELNSQPDL